MNPGEVFAVLGAFAAGAWVVTLLIRSIASHADKQLELRKLELQGRAPRTDQVDALRAEVADLRNQLLEVHERMDFTERLLAQGRDRDLLARGS